MIMIFNNVKRYFCSKTPAFLDIIICGGGIVGTTMACALAKLPSLFDKSIVLIEASPPKSFVPKESYSVRVSAISPFSKNVLERLGIWKHIHRAREVHNLKIWGINHNNFLELDNNLEGAVAYIVENDDIIQAVTNEVGTLSNLKILYKTNISGVNIGNINPSASLPKVNLEDGSEYQCQLLIGADGVNSKIRKAMDINYLSWDYNQMAVVATLKATECGTNNTAWQRFLPDGPIALLPLNNDLSSLVWSTTKTKAINLLKLPNENFVDAINHSLKTEFETSNIVKSTNNAMRNILGTFGLRVPKTHEQPPIITEVVEGSRAVFPLGFGHSVNYVSSNVVLVGDAAHRVHPLAGQGVNLGFQDIDCLENVLRNAIKNGRNIGDIEDLRKYEALCQKNNIPVMAFIELIHRIYTSNTGPLQALGDIFLQFASSFDPLKTQLNTRALFSRR